MDCILVAGISPADTITSIFTDFSPSVGCTQASKSCHQKQAQRNGCLIMFKSSSSFLNLEARNKNTSRISLRQLRKISRSLQTSKNNEKARLVRLVGSYWIPEAPSSGSNQERERQIQAQGKQPDASWKIKCKSSSRSKYLKISFCFCKLNSQLTSVINSS